MKIESISNYQVRFSDQFFLDTNVWLYLLYPQNSQISERIIRKYSEFYSLLLSKGSLVKTHPIQVSELINAFISIEHRIYKKNKAKLIELKEWKKTADFQKVRKDAQTMVKSIMKQSSLISGTFTPEELKGIVSQCDKADFNDLFFIKFAEKEGLNIVTHDADFKFVNNFSNMLLSANNNIIP